MTANRDLWGCESGKKLPINSVFTFLPVNTGKIKLEVLNIPIRLRVMPISLKKHTKMKMVIPRCLYILHLTEKYLPTATGTFLDTTTLETLQTHVYNI